jgi:outer membrane protein W
MKKLITFAFALLIFQLVNAQDAQTNERIFKKFKVDISLGYAIPQESGGSGSKAGAVFALEPKYAVMDELSVGLRMEGAAMANIDADGEKGNVKANYSYLATGDYYFSNKKFRPFGGIGAGVFTHASIDLANDNSSLDNIPKTSQFGFMARTGFEYGHLRIGVEYNFVAEKSGYLGLKIGGVIGGGRRK